nr:hypothetical protein [Tanacetum cinerariifolium]
AATVIIRNLTTEAHMHRYRGISQDDFVREMRQLGPGLYVLGLDYHVGFLRVREGGAVQMVHSSYTGAGGVSDDAVEAHLLARGQHGILGMVARHERADGGRPLAQLAQVAEILQINLLAAGGGGFEHVVEVAGHGLIVGGHKKGAGSDKE